MVSDVIGSELPFILIARNDCSQPKADPLTAYPA